ncbi:MAG: hypothetical protein RLP43_19425, partial [Thalassospira sp.]
ASPCTPSTSRHPLATGRTSDDEAGIEAKRLELETALTKLTQDTDAALGLKTIPPAGPNEKAKQKRSEMAAEEGGK